MRTWAYCFLPAIAGLSPGLIGAAAVSSIGDSGVAVAGAAALSALTGAAAFLGLIQNRAAKS